MRALNRIDIQLLMITQEHHHEIFQKIFFGFWGCGCTCRLSAFLNVHADYKSMLTIKGGHSRRK